MEFGEFLRDARERLRVSDPAFSVRKLAQKVGIEPAYLSKIERLQQPPPGEETIRRLAIELDEDPDVLLAMAGKVSTDLREAICRRPKMFAQLIRELKSVPDHAILRIIREVKDGSW